MSMQELTPNLLCKGEFLDLLTAEIARCGRAIKGFREEFEAAKPCKASIKVEIEFTERDLTAKGESDDLLQEVKFTTKLPNQPSHIGLVAFGSGDQRATLFANNHGVTTDHPTQEHMDLHGDATK